VVFALPGYILLSDFLLNLGNIAILQSIKSADGGNNFDLAEDFLKLALWWNQDNLLARWRMGHGYLIQGNVDEALVFLDQLRTDLPNHPLLCLDLIHALSLKERHREVIDTFEDECPDLQVEYDDLTRDMLGLAYLYLAKSASYRGDETQALNALMRARTMRSGDLYANFNLWKRTNVFGYSRDSRYFDRRLNHFPKSAIHPLDKRLLRFIADVIPELYKEGLWDQQKTDRVLASLVWLEYSSPYVESLLRELSDLDPLNPGRWFHLGELYQRQQEMEQARWAYEKSMALDVANESVYLRLGMVWESECGSGRGKESCSLAQEYYEQYYQRAPEDLLGLQRLAGLATDAEAYHKLAESKLNSKQILADLLDIPVDFIVLGPNLLPLGNFERWIGENPLGWRSYWQPRSYSSDFLFTLGNEQLGAAGRGAARIHGIWRIEDQASRVIRTGYWYDGVGTLNQDAEPIVLKAGESYMFTFQYRSSTGIQVWLTSHDQVLFKGDRSFPSTGGEIWKVMVVGKNRLDREIGLFPTIRLYGFGDLLLDDVQLRRVSLKNGLSFGEDPVFWLSSLGVLE